MDYRQLFKEENAAVAERYTLVMERIAGLCTDNEAQAPFHDFFCEMAAFITGMADLYAAAEAGKTDQWSLVQWQDANRDWYKDIVPEGYDHSYANPSYAVAVMGEDYGQLLSFLYMELRGMIVYALEGRLTDMTIAAELFMEIYGYFAENAQPVYKHLQKVVYWYISDYSDMTMEYHVRAQMDDYLSYVKDIICGSQTDDLRYLYRYGEFVGDNEVRLAKFLAGLPEVEILAMADTFVDGFVRGFKVMGLDLASKNSVNIRAYIGFERVIKESIKKFEALGLHVHVQRAPVSAIYRRAARVGFIGTSANPQCDYDHRQDMAIYLDKALNERMLSVLRVVYEKYKEAYAGFAGPAVMQVFGEEPFAPANTPESLRFSDKQQKLFMEYNNQASLLLEQYMDSATTSFTMIAYPLPSIGEDFEDIFKETVRINTLDNDLYTRVQQVIIDTLDKAEYVHVQGAKEINSTSLDVALYPLADAARETKFENCVADVNIPAGEVFTSPVLSGTNGTLHVSSVYLRGYNYLNLSVTFKDGMVIDYSCDNFGEEAENRRYIRENAFGGHDSLPLGEFAIGTNTAAYVMADKYHIIQKLPILIAEKMGPHFAVGDTCYKRAEDHKMYNPDGKEMIARENEISALRRSAPEKAYFNCHTDITIPYDEIGEIAAIMANGSRVLIIKDGRFVLPGTEILNEPFEKIS